MTIKIQNLLDQSAQYTYLSNGEASGVSTIRVKNINAFSASNAIQIGKTGEELSEIRVLGTAAVSGTSLAVTAATSYDHPTDTPVYNIRYDKLIVKRSTAGTAGTATALSGGTISITPDGTVTTYEDTSGSTSYAYKVSLYNSVTAEESADSDWLPGTGLAFYSWGAIRQRAKDKLFQFGIVKSDSVIADWGNEWLETLTNAAIKVNESFSLGTVNVAFTGGTPGLGTITSEDYKSLKRMWVSYNGVDTYRATKKDLTYVYPNEVFSSVHPYYGWRGDTVFEILPPQSGGTAQLIYNKIFVPLANDNDFLPAPMREYTSSFINYIVAEAYYSDKQAEMGDRFLTRANAGKNDFISEITPRDFTEPTSMQLDYVVLGDDDILF